MTIPTTEEDILSAAEAEGVVLSAILSPAANIIEVLKALLAQDQESPIATAKLELMAGAAQYIATHNSYGYGDVAVQTLIDIESRLP